MSQGSAPFSDLDPQRLLDAVESLGLRCDGRLLALNSYENRVFRVGIEDAAPLVAKFYRPGRWSDAAIGEEHAFTVELAGAGLSVVAPLRFAGRSLHQHGGHRFALFPLQGGRAPEAGDRDTLRRLGQDLARLHAIGARGRFLHRPVFSLDRFGREPLAALLAVPWIPPPLRANLERIGTALLDAVRGILAWHQPLPCLRLHGDCHLGNLLWRDERPHFVDFDDCLSAPAVWDLWMLLSGEADEQARQREWLMEGYETFREFDATQWALVEPLRALRLIHFNAWVAGRWQDPAFPVAFPGFTSPRHWEDLLSQLQEQLAVLSER
jgi:Ser/Thr protein kinase RdoA (MazF antagonist)